MRITSDREFKGKCGGWLHRIGADHPKAQPKPWKPIPKVTHDWRAMMARWEGNTDESRLIDFARNLGVTPESLHALGCCWSVMHNAWSFPMWSGDGTVIGIRLRGLDGSKFAVRGSKQGLFYDSQSKPEGLVYIVEGPTDASAGISIGLQTIGRPSCQGCVDHVNTLLKRWRQRAVIVADNDKPGIEGAKRLANELTVPCAVIVLPLKDLREAVRSGMTAETMASIVRSVVWGNARKPWREYRHQVNDP